MSDVVIRAEGIGKRYVIGHESRNEEHIALRDVIARGARRFLRKAGDMARGRPVVEGDDLEEVWALRDVGFEIGRGEVVGIIGRNGAGKSTLLKILSRITEPTSGRVEIRGRVASLLEVGTGFHGELTGRENIFLNGAILGMTRQEIRRKFDEIVAFAEVDRYLDTPVKRYSSGMYVRLAFAVAAHLEPEILIVDEVLAVGDAQFQRKCLGKMSEVSRGGRTVLFVSHQMGSVRALCGRAILLRNGSVAATGAVDHVIGDYMASLQPTQDGGAAPIIARYLKDARFIGAGDGERSFATVIGGQAAIRVVFALPRPSRTPVVGIIARRRETGEGVFGSNSRVCGQPVLDTPVTEACVEVTLNALALVPGTYLLDVWVGCDNEDLEGVEGLLELEIVDNNPHGTGKSPFTNFGSCFVPMRFSARGRERRDVAMAHSA